MDRVESYSRLTTMNPLLNELIESNGFEKLKEPINEFFKNRLTQNRDIIKSCV